MINYTSFKPLYILSFISVLLSHPAKLLCTLLLIEKSVDSCKRLEHVHILVIIYGAEHEQSSGTFRSSLHISVDHLRASVCKSSDYALVQQTAYSSSHIFISYERYVIYADKIIDLFALHKVKDVYL